jgi:flagellar biosynthesis protein FliQ
LSLSLVLLGPFMINTLDGFAHHLFDQVVAVGGS